MNGAPERICLNQQLVSTLRRHFKSSLFSPRLDATTQLFAGFLSGRVPEDLLTREMNDAGHTTLLLTGRDVQRYYETLNLLRRESELEYLTDKELKDQLWRLECEVFTNQTEYERDLSKLNTKLEEFVLALIKPLKEFEVLIPLENFRVGNHEINLVDCAFRHFNEENLLAWGFGRHEMWRGAIKDFVDRTAIVMAEVGNNTELVVERARTRADLRLHTLRVALAERNFTPDQQLRFRLSPHTALRDSGEPRIRSCQHIWPGPWDFEYSESHDKDYVDYAIDILRQSASLPKEIKERVERALYWFGRAVKGEELDQRVALLCTAMESLLSNKSDIRKGERLAYRMVLLESLNGNAFVHPAQLLWIYILRSSVIHGSRVEVVTKTEYRTMVHAARCTLKNYVGFVANNKVRRYSDLIRRLELSEEARQLSEWLGSHRDDKDVWELKKALDGALASY
jgi:Apea-like HEPN